MVAPVHAVIELDIDLGEHDGEPDELFGLAHRVNIACGGHAGDERSMTTALHHARSHGAGIGAHPSYPDRERFGRVTMAMTPDALHDSIHAQCTTLRTLATQHELIVGHTKLHGALYHDANRDPALARTTLEAILSALGNATIIGPHEGHFPASARALGLRYLREGFADRRYLPDGSLAPRTQADALITDPALAAAQAAELARSDRFDILCVHADTPGAAAIARAVRHALEVAR